MPTTRRVPLAKAALFVLPFLVQLQHASAQGYSTSGLHARADNTTEIQTGAKNKSTSTFVTALSTNAGIFVAQLIAFSILRLHFKSIYEPRTYVPKNENKRPPELGRFWQWPLTILKADFTDVLKHNGVDAYLYVRFHRMMAIIFGPIWVVSWGALMPVTGVDGGGDNGGLDRFTFGNIGSKNQNRYWAHLGCAWVFTAWICFMIYVELKHFIATRQNYLVDVDHSASAQANSILITGINDDYLSVKNLTTLFSHLPGGVRKVWLNHNLKELPGIYKRRMKACNILEKAETKLVEKAIKIRQGRNGKRKTDDRDRERALTRAERLVPKKDWPKHRLPSKPFPFALPLLSKKVDTIEWARKEIVETTALLEKGRRVIDRESVRRKADGDADDHRKDRQKEEYPALNSAFILFNEQISAHLAMQALVHHEPFKLTNKYIEVAPADVIWSNLGMKGKTMRIRMLIGYSITGALIILWSFPVAFIGAISNVSDLCNTYSWLSWVCDAPQMVIGIIQGVLPSLLLTILMSLLPRVLRLLARFEGVPRRTGVELSLMTRYFIFLVTHSFLIVTLSSGLVAALPELLEDPTSIPALLARELPKASTFFLTYVILQGLSGTGAGFLRISYFIIYYLKLSVAGSTPRSSYKVKYRLKRAKFGEIYPESTLLAVISIAYMVISPVINGLATATFFLFFQMEKYRFLYQFGQPASSDTGGLFFPRAIQHIFIGVYIQQICLCALFFLARGKEDEPSTLIQAILMLALVLITMLYNSALNRSYNTLIRALPLTRAGDAYKKIESKSRNKARHDDAYQQTESEGKNRTGPEAGEGSKEKGDSKRNTQVMDFYHPATAEPIRSIWIPQDCLRLHIAESEVKANERESIPSGCENATMDEKGHVKIDGHPPGITMDGDYGD